MDLKGKNVVVTGASGGIGSVLCKDLAGEGVKLLMISRNEDKLTVLKNELVGEGHSYIVADFTKTNDLDNVVNAVNEKINNIDVLINAAGVGVYKNIEDVGLDEWLDSMAINATAPFYLTKEFLPLLKKSKTSVIVNMGSGMGKMPAACRSVYCATKYALRGMTLSLAAEFENTNVNFVHITLGSTLTDFGPLTLNEKKEENLKGKAYFTPQWVSKKLVSIIKKGEYEEEIQLYPSDYSEKEWHTS